MQEKPYVQSIRELQSEIHNDNVKAGWWTDLTAIPEQSNLARQARQGNRLGKALVAEKLCLIHSEVSEAMEGARKNLQDDKLPHRKMIEVELADAVIRILDLCGALDLDIAGAIEEKRQYNAVREDHKPENRIKDGGKAY
jgi:NTP pyrophosphatase (non-canonical NTP hydrolase)